MILFIAGIIGLATVALSIAVVYMSNKDKGSMTKGFMVLITGGALAVGVAVGCPKYLIWQQEQEGAAELAKAEQNRQIAIQEAKAKEESAKSLANAEVIRAEGVAKANKIIGDSLQNNDAYIHYLWIEALKESKDQVIYVPTEAGIPVTESARFVQNSINKTNANK